MDNKDWSWIKPHMPRTVALLAEYREFGEGLHLDECWKRGVVGGQAGWFFAREGPICLGTPFQRIESPILCEWAEADWRRHGHVLLLAPLPGGQLCRRLNNLEREAWDIVGARRQKEAQRRKEYEEGIYGAN